MFKYFALLLSAMLTPVVAGAEQRDPTLPGNLRPAEIAALPNNATPLNLNAILITDAGKRAIINGLSVSTGQTLADGSRIVKINPHYVLVRRNGVYKKLLLVPSVKNPVK